MRISDWSSDVCSSDLFSLLSIIAPAPDLINAEVGMRAIREAHRRGRAGKFLHRHHMFQITKDQAAPFLPDGDAMQPKLPQFRPEVARKPLLPIKLRSYRGDAAGVHPRGSFADTPRIYTKAQIT